MNETVIWIGLSVFCIVFVAWIIWENQLERVFIDGGKIVKKRKGKVETIELSKLVEVTYHYHAVAGFISTWEFIDENKNSLTVDAEAKSITNVLSELELILSGFSLAEFKKKFEAGEVEDIINVWKNA